MPGRRQPTPAILGHCDIRLVKVLSIPKLARDLAVRLVERFAVIRISAAPHFSATAEFHFAKPVRIGERLPRHADDVRIVALENRFSLIERGDAARRDEWRLEARRVYGAFDLRHQRNGTTKRSALIGQSGRHALVTTLARIWINGCADLRLLGVFELAAF